MTKQSTESQFSRSWRRCFPLAGGSDLKPQLALLALLLLLVNTTQASVWTNTAGGAWEAAINWTNGGVPNAIGALANFEKLNITADVAVTLASGKTVGTVLFGDTDTNSAAGWTVSGSTLTLNNTTITVNPLGTGKSATISSLLAGGTAGTVVLTKNGLGRLVVSQISSTLSGDIAVGSGTLSASGGVAAGNRPIGSPSALGFLDPTRTITVNNGAVLTFTNSSDIFARGGTTVETPAPLLVVNAGGTLVIGDTSTSETGNGYGNNFGKITLNGGSISLLKGYNSTYGAAMLTDTITVGGAAASTISGNGMLNSVACLGYQGSTVGTTFDVADATGDANADLTVSAPLRNAPGYTSGTSLTKTGAGTMLLTAANTYSGNTVITRGTLALGPGGSIAGTPQVAIADTATFDVSALGFTFTGSPVQTLAGSSASGAGTILAPSKTVTLDTGARLSFQAAGGASPTVGKISVSGAAADLMLNGNAVTVNVTGSALNSGTYRLLDCVGTLSGTVNSTPTITGVPLADGVTASISTTTGAGGKVDLVVTPPCAPPTTSFHVTGGGSYVSGGLGVPVGLSGSQSGVTYQLYTNGIATGQTVSGAGPAISFGNQTQAATYAVYSTATNGYCVAQMIGSPGNVTVTIIHAPRITQAVLTPAGLVLNGNSGPPEGSYEVRCATNLATPRAAWFVSGATNYFDENGHFTVTNAFSAQAPATFYCLRVITNGAVRPLLPFIIAQPASLNVITGQTAMFSVTASGAASLTYQWFFNTNTPLSNKTNSTLTLTNVQKGAAGKYSVTVANYLGTTNSAFATLTVATNYAIQLGTTNIVPNAIPSVPAYPWFPDGHVSFLPDNETNGVYQMYWAGSTSYRSLGSNLTSQARNPAGGSALTPGASTNDFDNGGAWLTSVHRKNASELHGFYHAEDHNWPGYDNPDNIAWKSMAYCWSTNNGLTWTKVGQILTSSTPKPSVPTWGGAGDGCVVYDEKNSRWVAFYSESYIYNAVSTNAVPGPGTWKKYYNGGYSQPGLGGQATAVPVLITKRGGNTSVHFNTYLQRWVIVAHARASSDLWLSTSADLLNWTTPQLLVATSDPQRAWYPSIIGQTDVLASRNATLCYAYWPDLNTGGQRQFLQRSIEFVPQN